MVKYLRCMMALLLAVTLLSVTAYAADGGDWLPDFDKLYGSGGIFENKDNYTLDIEELGILDVMPRIENSLANLLFSLCRLITEISIDIFYVCAEFQLAGLMDDTLNTVQLSLKNNVVDALLPFAIVASLLFMAWLYLKRNGAAMAGQAMQFFVILVSITMLTTNTAMVVKGVDDLTMAVSNQVTAAISGSGASGDTYAVTVAETMWDTLVHRPWVGLNLNGNNNMSEKLLPYSPASEARQQYIADTVADANNVLFLKGAAGFQIAKLCLHLIALIIKCAVFVLIGLLQLTFRIFTIILAVTGILVLFLAMFPQMGGTLIISSWLKKVLSAQINIIMLSLLLGFVNLTDSWFSSLYQIPFVGWLLTPVFQSAVCALIFYKRNQLIDFAHGISNTVQNPYTLSYNMRRGIENADHSIYDATRTAGNALHGSIGDAKTAFKTQVSSLGQPMTAAHPARHSGNFRTESPAATPAGGYNGSRSITPAPVQRPMLYSATQTAAPDTYPGYAHMVTTIMPHPSLYAAASVVESQKIPGRKMTTPSGVSPERRQAAAKNEAAGKKPQLIHNTAKTVNQVSPPTDTATENAAKRPTLSHKQQETPVTAYSAEAPPSPKNAIKSAAAHARPVTGDYSAAKQHRPEQLTPVNPRKPKK